MRHAISPEQELSGLPATPIYATRAMARERASELALLAGRVAPYVIQADYEQAKRELTGEKDPQRQDAVFSANSASELSKKKRRGLLGVRAETIKPSTDGRRSNFTLPDQIFV